MRKSLAMSMLLGLAFGSIAEAAPHRTIQLINSADSTVTFAVYNRDTLEFLGTTAMVKAGHTGRISVESNVIVEVGACFNGTRQTGCGSSGSDVIACPTGPDQPITSITTTIDSAENLVETCNQ